MLEITRRYSVIPADKISLVEDHYGAKFVLETCLKTKDGVWSEIVGSVFFTETPHPAGSNYFALFYNHDGSLRITNALSSISVEFQAAKAKNGELIYSRYRHDYVTSNDGSVFIDGGRDYLRTNAETVLPFTVMGAELMII